MSTEQKIKPKVRRSPATYTVLGVAIGVLISVAGVLFALQSHSEPMMGVAPTATIPLVAPQRAVAEASCAVAVRCFEQVEISNDGTMFAVLEERANDTALYLNRLSDLNTLTINEASTRADQFTSLSFNPVSNDFIVTNELQLARRLEADTEAILASRDGVRLAAFSTDGTRVALYEPGRGIRLYDPNLTDLHAIVAVDLPQIIDHLALTANDVLAYSVGTTVYIQQIDLDAAPRPLALPDASRVTDLVFHPDGDWLAIATDDYLWLSQISATQYAQYPFNGGSLQAVAFSADNKWLVLAGGNAEAETALVQALRWPTDGLPPNSAFYEPVELVGHTHIVRDATFTLEGHLLTAAWDGTVRLWDLETAAQLAIWQR